MYAVCHSRSKYGSSKPLLVSTPICEIDKDVNGRQCLLNQRANAYLDLCPWLTNAQIMYATVFLSVCVMVIMGKEKTYIIEKYIKRYTDIYKC